MTPDQRTDEYLWIDGPSCRGCGSLGRVMKVNGLAFIVRCLKCESQTGLERCEADACSSWRKVHEP